MVAHSQHTRLAYCTTDLNLHIAEVGRVIREGFWMLSSTRPSLAWHTAVGDGGICDFV